MYQRYLLGFSFGIPLKKPTKEKISKRALAGRGANRSKDGREPASTGPMVKRR